MTKVTVSPTPARSSADKASRAMSRLLARARGCTVCAAHLPLGPRPVLRASVTVRLLIIGQAPGTKVHQTGIPWNDPSGERLRDWLQLDREKFYDESQIAIVPMGLCYPGRGAGGDLPPRPECAPLWHGKLRQLMPQLDLTLLIGAYAQAYYLGDRRKASLAETLRAWRDYAPFIPMPHPSPRNRLWLRKNAWFEAEAVPAIRDLVARAVTPVG